MLGVRDIFQLIYNWFIFLFLFFYSVNLYSFKPILITDDFKSISLGNYISLYEDKEGKLDINTIQSPEIKWFSSSKESPSFGFTKSVFWVKYQIQNSSPKKKTLYLEINYPMIDKVEMFAIQSKQIQVDHFLKQKKNFKFKKFSSEIGGDICSVSKVILEDKSYIAFINGDAMGKSIQGAGGAIVIGTAFKTIITRTQKISKDFRTPEKWLNDTFTELQNIFISFDGSMLASAVLGLIEERTGKLYFINAEHPYTVLSFF